ncbi:protein-tyrosine phosphatase-like protein [Mycena epipterygia]|nr:protein-tyrosine phosphatase-like protein [Mycena epipterygia]
MMIQFESVPPAEMEAMCTPMHRVLSPLPQPTQPALKNGSGAQTGPASTGALYLGSMAAVHEPGLLRTHHIKHLVQVLEVPWLPQDDADAAAGGYTCHRIDIQDRKSTALRPHLAAACDYIRASLAGGENVLVHCQQGVSRSASIVIAYLIRERAMSYDAAYELVKSRRQCIRPNSGFVVALRDWEAECRPAQESKCRTAAVAAPDVDASRESDCASSRH